MCEFLTEKLSRVISVSQHGLMKGRSMSTNLIEFVNDAIRVVDPVVKLMLYTLTYARRSIGCSMAH